MCDYAYAHERVSDVLAFRLPAGEIAPVAGVEAWEVIEGAIPAFAGRAAQLGSLR